MSRGVEVTKLYPLPHTTDTIIVCKLGSFSPYPCGMNAPGLMNENAAKKAHIHVRFAAIYQFPILTKGYALHELTTFILSGFLEHG